jgi:transcriptional regulator with XRE-family HTH domain
VTVQRGRQPRPKNLGYRQAFGNQIRSLREQTGQSQETLANDTGIARRYLSEIEQGRANPSLDLIVLLAEALDLPPSDLLPPAKRTT